MFAQRPRFREIDTARITRAIEAIPVIGKPIAPKSARACKVCRRRIQPLGRLPALGFPTCDSLACQLCRIGDVTKHFETPYGRAIDRSSIGMFSQLIEMPDGRVLAQRQPIVERAAALADALDRLVRWQSAFDHYEWFTNPEGYNEGAVELIPPHRIEDVIILRAREEPIVVTPTGGLPGEKARLIGQVFKQGPEALQPAF